MILCCGESLIDMVPQKLADGATALLPVSGGAVFNTAIGLGRLGIDTEFFCPLSHDLFGEQLADTLHQSHVETGLCPRVSRPTTLAFVQLTNGHAKYVFYDENTALKNLQIEELPVIPVTCRAGFFGGISLIGEPCGGAYETLMQRMQPHALIIMDPNIRTSFITNEAQYRARITRMMGMSDILKFSDEDFAWLFPTSTMEDAARKLIANGTQIILITRGSDKPLAITADAEVEVDAIKVEVADTIGAGDTFNAGFLAALSMMDILDKNRIKQISRTQVEKALRLAAATAAITVSRVGANPPTANEVAQYLP